MSDIVKMYENDKKSIREIASELKISQYSVIKKLKEAGTIFRNHSEAAKMSYTKGRVPAKKGEQATKEFRDKVSERTKQALEKKNG